MKARPFLQGAGFATLYIALYAADFLNPTVGDAYHRFFPLTTIYRAILLLTLLLWVAGGLAFWTLERMSPLWKRIFWLMPIVLLPWLFFCSMTAISFVSTESTLPFQMLRLRRWTTPAFGAVALLLLIVKPKLYDRCVNGIRYCYMVAGFGLLVILPRIGFMALKSGSPERPGFERAGLPEVSPDAARIVWILMDELSYDQAFASRQPDVQLPNFDRLAQTSVSFSDLQPPAPAPGPGSMTEDVLPALMLGKSVVALQKPYLAPLAYRTRPGTPWHTFNENDTIFGDARSLGWSTGLAGWYNPYCRLLPNVLDRCVWVYSEPAVDGLSRALSSQKSIVQNMVQMTPLPDTLNTRIHGLRNEDVQTHTNDYLSVMAHAKDLIQDSRIRFAFIHLPIPHPPGIYDRVHHVINGHGSYLDDLVLADESLGTLEEVLQSTPAAANTVLILSSDHSWRPFLWKGTPDWSEEAEAATHGNFDPRPVLMIHLPGQQTAHLIAKPVNVLITHTILEGLLHGQIRDAADVDRLIDARPQQSIALQSAKASDPQARN
ncbi:MAG TPA: hypothetical protein VF126_02185 [Acidobacteriaceae bacterium]